MEKQENMRALQSFFHRQLEVWPSAGQRFADLNGVETKPLGAIKAQFNPARMVSTGAKVDKRTLAKRPCFLCAKNRPEEQMVREFNAQFDILVNPFPILPLHFTIASRSHELQKIEGRLGDMLEFIDMYPDVLIFYNGPKCGASAPDHLHFQAGTREVLPAFGQWTRLETTADVLLSGRNGSSVLYAKGYVSPLLAITARTMEDSRDLFKVIYRALPSAADDIEPMMNIVAWKEKERFILLVFPRHKHRPDCYSAEGEAQFMVSPGAIDMSGLLVMPRKEDFDRITPVRAAAILNEVSLPKQAMRKVVERIKAAK